MRIVIVGDSLSMPRVNVPINECWIHKFIVSFINNEIYTILLPGLSIKRIYDFRYDIMRLYDPDLIIFQFGIVDASRRALPDRISRLMLLLKPISKLIRPILSKNHYKITRIFNFHRVHVDKFDFFLKEILLLKNRKTKIIFIPIAQPGDFLVQTTFNINKDVQKYNSVFMNSSDSESIFLIDSYKSDDANMIVLKEDGHHLSPLGHELVFSSLKKIITNNILIK